MRNYGKIDPYVQMQYEAKRKERRRIIVIISASVFLTVAVICLAVGLVVRKHNASSSSDSSGDSQYSTGSAAIVAACNMTRYPDTCTQSLSEYPGSLTANPAQLVAIGSKVALAKVTEAYELAMSLTSQAGLYDREIMALEDCTELLGNTMDYLNGSVLALTSLDLSSLTKSLEQVEILLSTASSEQTACSDNFDNITGSAQSTMLLKQGYVNEVLINALGLVEALSRLGGTLNSWKDALPSVPKIHLRRLLGVDADDESAGKEVPWASAADRELLGSSPSPGEADIVVDATGATSGSYKTVKAALKAIPESYTGRYVIYIKAGTYDEGPLNISKSLVNLTLLGDGCNETIITGDANVAIQNYTTYRSATLGVAAKGFLAKNITFRNTAGPEGHQAVAVRINAENAVFEGCCFEGYQDTLYALSGKQFYKECEILGTVDYVFGNALAVFQNCDLVARQPTLGQQNTYTAQGRKDDAQVTGFSFQGCNLVEGDDLKSSTYNVSTYLGRPWKPYSTTVFLQSYMEGHINPAGWLAWNASSPYESTCFYGEYLNTGPGSGTSQRVNWTGVHPQLSESDASQFTIDGFFPDTSFIPTDVPYQASL